MGMSGYHKFQFKATQLTHRPKVIRVPQGAFGFRVFAVCVYTYRGAAGSYCACDVAAFLLFETRGT